MKAFFSHMLTIVALTCMSGVAAADPWKDESGHGRGPDRHFEAPGPAGHARGSYFHDHGYARLEVPPGHYPPPGKCRAWFPGRPPGHQPPPGPCGPVPAGAWLIRHPHHRPHHVHVTVYEPARPRHVLAMGEFEIDSGALVRVILER